MKQDVESDDEEVEMFKGSSIPSDELENNIMTKLSKPIIKSQEEYKTINKQPDSQMYKHTERQRPEDILPPTYEVRINNARLKKQEQYEKLSSKAF